MIQRELISLNNEALDRKAVVDPREMKRIFRAAITIIINYPFTIRIAANKPTDIFGQRPEAPVIVNTCSRFPLVINAEQFVI